MWLIKIVLKAVAIVVLVGVAILALAISYSSSCPGPTPAGSGETMTAVTYQCYGGPEVLQLSQISKPEPGPKEVLVKVHYAGVNPLDWHYMRGSPYLMRLGSGIGAPTDSRLGVDFAGVVESVGEHVRKFKPGDKVFGGRSGAFGEYIVAREMGPIAHLPDKVSLEQAATVGIAGLTALQALRDKGQLQAGQKVLINGASGGVGTFAVQIARSMGAEVTGVSSAGNHPMVRKLGAHHVIDYKQEDYTQGSERYDLIVDMVGNHSARANSGVLTPGGRLVLVGGGKGDWIGPIGKPLQALFYGPFIEQEMIILMAKMNNEDLNTLAGLMASGQLSPVIGHHYPLAEISEAMALSESSRARGKIAIAVASP